jgi:predicted ATPase
MRPSRSTTPSSTGHDPGVCCRAFSALVLFMLGHPDVALRHAAEAVAVARTLEQPASLTLTLGQAAIFHQLRGDPESARDLASDGLTIANEHHIATQQMFCQFMHGWGAARTGLRAEGLAEMQRTRAAMDAAGMVFWVPHFCGMIAEVCDEPDRAETGLAAANEGIAIADATGQVYYVAELNRLRGELLLLERGESAVAEAEVSFLRALEIARQQEARAWELRAAMSLARLAQQQGKRTEARSRLAEIYAGFTAGSDAPDLRAARALLDALA